MRRPISARQKKWRLESLPALNLDALNEGGQRTPSLEQVLGEQPYGLPPGEGMRPPLRLEAGPAVMEPEVRLEAGPAIMEPGMRLEVDPAIIESRGESPAPDHSPWWESGLARETRLPEGIEADLAPLRDLDVQGLLPQDADPDDREELSIEEQQVEATEDAQRDHSQADLPPPIKAEAEQGAEPGLPPWKTGLAAEGDAAEAGPDDAVLDENPYEQQPNIDMNDVLASEERDAPVKLPPPVTEMTPPAEEPGLRRAAAQEMPEPIERPRRRDVGRNRALAAFSAAAAGITGRGDHYQQSLDRQNREANRDYGVDVDRYNRQVTERDKTRAQGIEDVERYRKRAARDRPMPESIRRIVSEHYGAEVPPGTTIEQWDDYTRNSMNSIGARRADLEQSKLDAAGKAAAAEQARANKMADAKEMVLFRNAHKKRRGGGGGGGGGVARGGDLSAKGMRVFEESKAVGQSVMRDAHFEGENDYMDALEDIQHGFKGTARARALLAAVTVPQLKDAIKLADSIGSKVASANAAVQRKFSGYFGGAADERAGLAAWDKFRSEHSAEELLTLFNGAKGKVDHPWTRTEGEKGLVTALRKPIASFLRQMTGAAMTPAELGLHAGDAGGMLIASGGGWLSKTGLAQKIENHMKTTGSSASEILGLIGRVRERAKAQMQSLVDGASIAALRSMPKAEQQRVLEQRVGEAGRAGRLEGAPPGEAVDRKSIRLDRYKIRFKWKDGTEGVLRDE